MTRIGNTTIQRGQKTSAAPGSQNERRCAEPIQRRIIIIAVAISAKKNRSGR